MMLLQSWLAHSASSEWDAAKQQKEQDKCCLAQDAQRLTVLARGNQASGKCCTGLFSCCAVEALRRGLQHPLVIAGLAMHSPLSWGSSVAAHSSPWHFGSDIYLRTVNAHRSSFPAASALPWVCTISRGRLRGNDWLPLWLRVPIQNPLLSVLMQPIFVRVKKILTVMAGGPPSYDGKFRPDPQIK